MNPKPVTITVTQVRFEHLNETLGAGENRPRISWITQATEPGWEQSSYEIELLSGKEPASATSGQVASAQSLLVPWPFAALPSRQRVAIRVRVCGADGSASPWSEATAYETGLLQPSDWSASFITPGWEEDASQPQPGPLLRREFTARAGIRQARLYISALGLYEASLNGQTVGDHIFAPGWTSYKTRLAYQTYDVTPLLRAGQNTLGAMLGDGWFRSRLGYNGGRRCVYGERLALLAQLEITYNDGSLQTVVSDASWRAASGPIRSSEIYNGEDYDARLERTGWDTPGFDDSAWAGVRPIERDLATLVAPAGPPVRRVETLKPIAVFTSPSGQVILDFGQNLVGRLRIHVQGAAGQVVILRHAEVLERGELCLRPLRYARATDSYTLKGSGLETWEPRFTFHGFRYAGVEGWPGVLHPEDIEALVCHSDMQRTGWFECSDPLVNRLHENVVWSMRGNFLSIPTDCPQRDERLGWTGDIQVFSPTASFLYDCAGFLSSWLSDLADEQNEFAGMPYFVPNVMPKGNPPAAAWGDAAVIVPWVLYQRFGDSAILARQFESMRAWVDQIAALSGEKRLWDSGLQFGDWLDPAAPPDLPSDARTPPFVVASAYFARSAELVGQAAAVLGRQTEEEYYQKLASEVRAAFNRSYVTPAGRVLGDSATAYALALQFALLPDPQQRLQAGQRLAELVHANRYRVSTGFVGTPLICDALCSIGQTRAAYSLLMQRENPSWLYPVTMGATTIWERWDSLLPDGSVNPGGMTSFNHYSLGAIADWLQRRVAGLAPAAPGYRKVEIRPTPGGGLSRAAARLRTPYGLAESKWNIADGLFTLDVTLPANTSGRVFLPGQTENAALEIAAGSHRWSVPYAGETQAPPAFSLDMTIGALIDHPQAFQAFLGVLRDYDRELTLRLESQIAMTLREAASLMRDPEEAFARINRVLTQARLQE